jgi:hypothetical protein
VSEREGLQNILDYRTAPETGQTKVAGDYPEIWSILRRVFCFWTINPGPMEEVVPDCTQIVWHGDCLNICVALSSRAFLECVVAMPGSERSYAHDGVVVTQRHTSLTRKSSRRPVTGHSKTKGRPHRGGLCPFRSRARNSSLLLVICAVAPADRGRRRHQRNKELLQSSHFARILSLASWTGCGCRSLCVVINASQLCKIGNGSTEHSGPGLSDSVANR